MAQKNDNRRIHIQILMVAALVLLIGKAAQLQLFNTDFRKKADAVAVEKYTIYPSRGLIYDRNDQLLVTNNPMYDLLVTYNHINPDMDTLKFCKLLKIKRAGAVPAPIVMSYQAITRGCPGTGAGT